MGSDPVALDRRGPHDRRGLELSVAQRLLVGYVVDDRRSPPRRLHNIAEGLRWASYNFTNLLILLGLA